VPDYLYPGVYVVELESTVKSIEGVSTSTAGVVGADCIERLTRLASPAPDVSTGQAQDAGVALLEVLAYVAELLVERGDVIADEAVLHSLRLATASLALARNQDVPRGGAVKAVSFYEGRLLREEVPKREHDRSCHLLHIGKDEASST
jgi:phage tail sheath protein FI